MAFWAVIGSAGVVGAWLLATERLLAAAAVLVSGAALGAVLALLGRPQGSSIVDLSSNGLRARGRASAAVSAIFLVAGAVGWSFSDAAVWRVLILAGGGGLLGSGATLWTARHNTGKGAEPAS
ncbi:hypothetical protein N869_15095 [Cellulomonas bogoriensis 69B4 = DSM 16987]|uniref:Uncharacterized protein n=1 Tax=Cellulomonas bogoriensis 69B4 = DSM 16987 TaxID=1386082 RepID=A0A0A0C4Q9_9CELL|nr:hypothetical protein N869_15095 [Cellulomonas bogoriensis 69B4 = DSM 16987]